MSATNVDVKAVSPVITREVIEGLNSEHRKSLKHTEVVEKMVLPSKEDIESEKKHLDFVNGLESFDKNKLKPATTQEKIVLPDKESKKKTLCLFLLAFEDYCIYPYFFLFKAIETEKKQKLESEI